MSKDFDEIQIGRCKDKISVEQNGFTDLSKVLELAGNEVRLKILYLLKEEKELCPCDISSILQMSLPAVSQHLRKLKDGNVIQSKKTGQTILYSLKKDCLPIINPLFKHLRIKSAERIN